MKTHPLAAKVPAQSQEEFDRLVVSMKDGFDPHRPIITLDSMILDGRHRYNAAIQVGVKPHMQSWKPAFKGDTPEQFVLRSTIHRSLTHAQRAAIAAELLPEIEQHATERKTSGKAPPRSNHAQQVAQGRAEESAEVAAKAAGTNRAYVRVAAQAKQTDPKVFEGMKKGEVSVLEAKRLMKAPPRPAKTDTGFVMPEGGDQFKELVNRTHALRRDIEALTKLPAGVELSKVFNRINAAMESVAGDLRFKSPHCGCPFGPSCEVGCKACQGRKWLSKDIYDALPEAMKK